jgi:hypothetical protein
VDWKCRSCFPVALTRQLVEDLVEYVERLVGQVGRQIGQVRGQQGVALVDAEARQWLRGIPPAPAGQLPQPVGMQPPIARGDLQPADVRQPVEDLAEAAQARRLGDQAGRSQRRALVPDRRGGGIANLSQ